MGGLPWKVRTNDWKMSADCFRKVERYERMIGEKGSPFVAAWQGRVILQVQSLLR
jgi:hypothetical protein